MKQITNLIIFLLCLCLLGFFANFAQNEYGMSLILMSLIGIYLSLNFNAYQLIKMKKWQSVAFISNFVILILLILPVHIENVESIFSICIVYFVITPTLIIPLSIQYQQRKQENKISLITYYESVFLSHVCLGYFMKGMHKAGASFVLVSAFFLIIPYLIYAFKQIIHLFKSWNITNAINICSLIFIVTNLDAAVFARMHWKGGKILAYTSITFYGLMVLFLIINRIYGNTFLNWWKQLRFNNKLCMTCFTLTTLYWILSRNGMAPVIYSNEMPIAFEKLVENANSITDEGKEYGKRADVYETNYIEFINQQEEE